MKKEGSSNPNIFLTLTGSKNAPFACYEEIQSHGDRFGNCGKVRGKFQFCSWRYAMQILKLLMFYKIFVFSFSLYMSFILVVSSITCVRE